MEKVNVKINEDGKTATEIKHLIASKESLDPYSPHANWVKPQFKRDHQDKMRIFEIKECYLSYPDESSLIKWSKVKDGFKSLRFPYNSKHKAVIISEGKVRIIS